MTLAELGERVGPGPVGAVPAGERPPGAEAVAHRGAGQGAVGAGRGAAAAAAAEPPGPAGDRAGGGPARPASTPSSGCRTLKVGARGTRPTCWSTWSRCTANCAASAPGPTATPEEARLANAELRRRHAGAGQLLPGDRAAAARRWTRSATAAARCPRARCWRSSPTTASPSATPQDLPRSVRSVTDLRHRRIYLQAGAGRHALAADHPAADPRALRARPRRARGTSPTSSASGSRPTTSPRPCWCPSRSARPVPGRREARPRTCRWRTCATCSRCRTRWPRTGSPTWPPTTWT